MAFSKRYAALFTLALAFIIYLTTLPLPPSPPPSLSAPYTAAIVYLVSVLPGPRNPEQLLQSLPQMQKNIPWRHQWPVLLLHAGVYDTPERRLQFLHRLRQSAEEQELTAEATDMLIQRIEFVPTSHELPPGIPTNGAGDAYHHVCAFFSHKIFSHPRISNLTYFLRLDDDSHITHPTCIDPFEYMHTKNLSYAFRQEGPRPRVGHRGMWPFVSNYAQRHPAVEETLQRNNWEWPDGRFWPGGDRFGLGENFRSYETNFELVKVERFTSLEMREFLEELASDPKRFYWSRWGDAPLRLAQVYMFLDVAKEVHKMCEIPYAHKDEVFKGCECVPL
ncbi:glycosyltransferase family 15 protein [Favolaschia claudopus]|uniref:Glycosyltransferase family 15 protein n=1 Tax=Favolaschia claudopus TaxID=2862362 RepID=A0AAW0CE41_9AGAR